MTANDLIYDAALEVGIVGIENPLQPAIAAWGLRKLNRIADNWNADRDAVWAEGFTQYTLIPNHQPHTIGPTGDFVVTGRPVSIEFANTVITGVTPSVTYPIDIHKSYGEWWASQSVQGLATQYATDLYYEAAMPNGKLWLWPIPTTAYDIQLFTRVVIPVFAANTTIAFAPGYQDAFTLTLAEDMGPAFDRDPSPQLVLKASQARQRAFSNNRETPLLTTRDSGMPPGRSEWLNWRTGLMAK